MIVSQPARRFEFTLDDAAADVALDDYLLQTTEDEDAPPILRLWELSHPAVIVGRSNRVEQNVNVAACRADGVPIIRRSSGGGTVLLGPGSLVYSLILRVDSGSRLVDIDSTTRLIMNRIRDAVQNLLPGVRCEGVSDLAIDSLKVSGNSQRWLRRTVLHHGTFLYQFDLPLIERYLGTPERVPKYRVNRSHREFLRNIPLSREDLVDALVETWDARLAMPMPDLEAVQLAARERYRNDDWNFRR